MIAEKQIINKSFNYISNAQIDGKELIDLSDIPNSIPKYIKVKNLYYNVIKDGVLQFDGQISILSILFNNTQIFLNSGIEKFPITYTPKFVFNGNVPINININIASPSFTSYTLSFDIEFHY